MNLPTWIRNLAILVLFISVVITGYSVFLVSPALLPLIFIIVIAGYLVGFGEVKW